ncbi:glycosyltransferase [Sphingomonas sp. 22176]|uniref:glycosyltransferase n=1 Tax=Sphingomonas sp. 22176 TaxID=3453884 RepID=UPI003F84E38E
MTRAVERLVDSADGFRNIVYSMTRVGNLGCEIAALRYAPDRVAIAYSALPKGLGLRRAMARLAQWIAADLRAHGVAIDLIHAHKLTTDGIVASLLAREFGVPYLCSIWGDADGWVWRGRPDLHRQWREIAASARALIATAPWAAKRFSAMLRVPPEAIAVLPVMGGVAEPTASTVSSDRIVSLFHLAHWRRKGITQLIAAMQSTAGAGGGAGWQLDIVGGGPARSYLEVDRLIAKAGARARVQLLGPVPNGSVRELLGASAMLALPSQQETFGMVFVEALFAGIPVLYPAGWAIDGYLPPERIGYACRAEDPADIARGLRHVMTNQQALKESIAQLQAEGALARFAPHSIALDYRRHLSAAVA